MQKKIEGNLKKDLCIVHVGMPKTGSTTIQEAFAQQTIDPRVCYVKNQAGWLYGLFTDEPLNYHFFQKIKIVNDKQLLVYKESAKKALIESFINSTQSKVILSGEDAFHLKEDGVRKLELFLRPFFKKILVIAYVRPLKSFLESAFQQLVKHHDQSNLEPKKLYHRYRNFERYDKVFGKENVKLITFDPSRFPNGDIVLDFCEQLEIKPVSSRRKVVNESLSKEAVSILFTYNFHANAKTDFGGEKHKVQDGLVEAVRKIGSQKFQLSNQYVNKVLEEVREDYAWILKRMDDSLDEWLNLNDTSGISTERELMVYSTDYIDDLVQLIGDKPIPFKLEKHPQTVAKLVDILAVKIYKELDVAGGNNDNR